MRKILISAGIAAALMGAASPAAANGVAVNFQDLDLGTLAGMETLESRIDSAAEMTCVKPDIRDLRAMKAFLSCKEDAKSAAIENIENAVAVASISGARS